MIIVIFPIGSKKKIFSFRSIFSSLKGWGVVIFLGRSGLLDYFRSNDFTGTTPGGEEIDHDDVILLKSLFELGFPKSWSSHISKSSRYEER